MAAQPKKKISKVRGKTRRAGSFRLKRVALTKCAKCGSLKRAHTVCSNCGFYGDKKVLTTISEKKVAAFMKRKRKEEAKKKKEARGKERRAKSQPKAKRLTKTKTEKLPPVKKEKEVLKQVLEEKRKEPRRSLLDIFRRRGER